MTMPDQDGPEAGLEAVFAAARGAAARPVPDDLMARVLRDAAAVQPSRKPVAPAPAATAGRPRGLGAVLAGLGGWPALSGLAAAGVTGFWLGFAPPAPVAGWQEAILGPDTDAALAGWLPSYDLALAEGE